MGMALQGQISVGLWEFVVKAQFSGSAHHTGTICEILMVLLQS
jgi:hypothetical protein